LAFGAESLESRRLLSMAGTNPLANLPTAVAPPSASVTPTPTVAAPTPTGAAQGPGASQFGNAFGIGQVLGFGGQAIGIVENIYVMNIEQGVGQSQPSFGLTELDLFIGIGSTGSSAPTSTFAPSVQAPSSPSASQVSTTPTVSAASTMTQPETSSLAFQIAEFIVASQSAATQAALSGAGSGAAATAPTQAHSSSTPATALVGQATSSVTIFGTSFLSTTSLAGSFLNSSSTAENGTTSLATPFAPAQARPPQPVLNAPDTSKLRGNSATPEREGEPPLWPDLLNAPPDTWMSMPSLHLSRLGEPARDPSGADRAWDSAVSALMADQVESMASATPEQLPTLGETSETISPIESALAAGLAVTAWIAWERRTRGSDRLRQRQTPDLTFDTLQ
jgi:hypothetical protein